MAIFGAALLALSAVNAISQIRQGQSENEEALYNASLLGEKADAIQVKKELDYAKYERMRGRTYSTSMANIGAMGIEASGSAMAVVLDTQKQIMIDQTISQFNIEQEKQYTIGEAEAELRRGDRARRAGYSNAFTSILSGVSQYGLSKYGVK